MTMESYGSSCFDHWTLKVPDLNKIRRLEMARPSAIEQGWVDVPERATAELDTASKHIKEN